MINKASVLQGYPPPKTLGTLVTRCHSLGKPVAPSEFQFAPCLGERA